MKSTLNIFLKGKKISEFLGLPLIGLLLITIFPLSGCSQIKNKITNDELEKNIRLWKESKITNYNFVIGKIDMGTWGWMPSLIKVRNNQAISKEPIGEPGPMTRIDGYTDFETVEKAFNTIQEAYDKEYRVEVLYNKEFGYPKNIIIDPRTALTDTVFTTEINKFEIIKE